MTDLTPFKKETHRVKLTFEKDRIKYPYDVYTPTADVITTKILLNNVLSTPNVKFRTANIRDFYFCTKLEKIKQDIEAKKQEEEDRIEEEKHQKILIKKTSVKSNTIKSNIFEQLLLMKT